MRWIRPGLLIACLLVPWMGTAEEPPLPMGLEEPIEKPAKTAAPEGEPELPPGLEPRQEPPLPAGIGEEPPLPEGMGEEPPTPKEKPLRSDWRKGLPLDVSGFLESRGGSRIQTDPTQKKISIAEVRLQLQLQKAWESFQFNVTSDFLYDGVPDGLSIDLNRGEGWIDLRKANVLYRASTLADFKLGRQILTWGTGDLIFINDLFPKDWNSFFIGRDEEYLKAPSDAFKVSFFPEGVSIDVVYTPRFDSDRFIDGRRISYFNDNVGQVVGRNLSVNVIQRDKEFSEDEWALRLYRNFGAFETALYGYWGFWKSPNGFDPASGFFTFPELHVYGASVRGPVLSGIAHAEIGYYDSRDDKSGNNPLIRNSEFRVLVGYERELLPELTGSIQYYLERMMDHDAFLVTLPPGFPARDENRHVITVRLTRTMMNQNLTLSLFNFYSPSDRDGYLRSRISYKFSDAWKGEIGGNIFYGSKRNTFFGQLKDNSNLYLAVRFGF